MTHLDELFEKFSAAVKTSETLRGWTPARFAYNHIGVERGNDAASDCGELYGSADALVGTIERLVLEM